RTTTPTLVPYTTLFRSARLPELIVVEHEVLAQQRHVDRRTHRREIVEAAAEVPGVGQHRDRVGAVARVGRGERDGIEIVLQNAADRKSTRLNSSHDQIS